MLYLIVCVACVQICIGYTDLPSRLPTQSSTLYSNNISKFLLSMGPFTTGKKDEFVIDYDDEAVRGALVLDEGELRFPPPAPPAPAQVSRQPGLLWGGVGCTLPAV